MTLTLSLQTTIYHCQRPLLENSIQVEEGGGGGVVEEGEDNHNPTQLRTPPQLSTQPHTDVNEDQVDYD